MDELYAGGNATTAEDRLASRLLASEMLGEALCRPDFDVDRPAGRMRYDEPDVSTGTFSEQDTTTSDLNLEPLRFARACHPEDCLLAVTIDNRVVGMVRALHEGPHVIRINIFRIHPDWQHTPVLAKLIDRLHRYCWNRGYLKVILESQAAPALVRKMFEHRGFHLVRRRRVLGKELLDYYVDLYSPPEHEPQ
jgi:N-acetylglutamate synthase-like GNAT family acetyltransferase